MSTIRVAIAGVGNCASSLVQGISYYRDAQPGEEVPGLMHVVLGRLPRGRPRARGRLRRRRRQGRHRPRQGHLRRPEQHRALRRGRRARGLGPAGPDLRRPGQVLPPGGRGVPGRAGRRGRRPARGPGRRAGRLPPGRLRAGPAPLRRGVPGGQGGLRQRHPGVHRLGPGLGPSLPRGRRPHRRRRHQEPGRLDHRPPGAHPPLRGPGPGPGPHLPAQRRRQHGLQEHARARAARVEEDLQDPGRHQPDRAHPPPRGRRAHRPFGPRAVAGRPQVGLRAHGGPQLRRRAAQPRAQARGLGLPQLGRRHHRRRALRQAGPRPRASAGRCSGRRPTS